jgi:hypothetical protein
MLVIIFTTRMGYRPFNSCHRSATDDREAVGPDFFVAIVDGGQKVVWDSVDTLVVEGHGVGADIRSE